MGFHAGWLNQPSSNVWAAIAAAIGLVSALLAYFLKKKERKSRGERLLAEINKEMAERERSKRRGLIDFSANRATRINDVGILLRNTKDNP